MRMIESLIQGAQITCLAIKVAQLMIVLREEKLNILEH